MSVIKIIVHSFSRKIELIKLNHDIKFIFIEHLVGDRRYGIDRYLDETTTIRTAFYGPFRRD